MIAPQTLGNLSNIHQLLSQLVQDLPANEVNQRFHPELPSMGWLLGRSVYLELHWLREKLLQDDELSSRVKHLFAANIPNPELTDSILPPQDHLLNWALEIQGHNLTLLANPRGLPDHPWLQHGWLGDYILQTHGRIYERMISVLAARALQQSSAGYVSQTPLRAQPHQLNTMEVSQGHYRIGAREGVVFDNEQPVQMVELNNFRICLQPVSNAEYLGFLQAQETDHIPWHWRKDQQANWHAMGLNGPMELQPDEPVSGLSHRQAQAYANWVSANVEGFKGAILQHEYQWEAAARTQGLGGFGRVWEWCNNKFQAYADYAAPVDPEMTTREFDGAHFSQRGGCLHTQPSLRRISYRQPGKAGDNFQFTGARLVLPPAHEEDALYIEQWQSFLK
jgi:iron(II)-dependent oxidoreductase